MPTCIDGSGSVAEVTRRAEKVGYATPVVPDSGGHGEDALEDPDGHARHSATAVVFNSELIFEGVVDRFDGQPDSPKQRSTGTWCFVAVGGPNDGDTSFVQPCFRGAVAVAFVHDQDESVLVMEHGWLQGDQIDEYVRLVDLRIDQSERDRQTVHGGGQVQPQTPKLMRV
jgi:hypothetical protein